ncbi:MAG: YicC/YloC family endoribonuclease [Vicingaceae bacterium]
MIHSMTGFGKAEGEVGGKKIVVQLKSLNSKQSDINIKLPNGFKEKELRYRKLISDLLGRGKVELFLSYENQAESGAFTINAEAYKSYYRQLKNIHQELNEELSDLVSSISRLPDVIVNEEESFSDKEWAQTEEILKQAAAELIDFRKAEGESLHKDLKSHVTNILNLLQDALKYENERIETVKERLNKNLEEAGQKEKVDQDRFEQEMIYYIEKYDISEEKVRLQTHCNYFIETMGAAAGQGKKLGFIGQEIGREINTLGSKANHAEMQQLVVQMKDELEKIKEQVLNVW